MFFPRCLFLALCLSATPALAVVAPAADVNQGIGGRFDGSPSGFARMGDLSYFRACDRAHGCELWQSDGTAAGTRMVADICPGECHGASGTFTVAFGQTLYFGADDGAFGVEPYRYRPADGVPQRIADLSPGAQGSFAFNYAAASSGNLAGVFFVALPDGELDSRKTAIFRATTSNQGVFVSEALAPGELESIGAPVAVGDRLFFRAASPATSTGSELWTLRATGPGTFVAEPTVDIFPGSTGATIEQLTPHPQLGVVFFRARDQAGNTELWRSDGTAAGTFKLGEIRPGVQGSAPTELTVLGAHLLFTAEDSAGNRELWRTGGTVESTTKVTEIRDGTGGSNPSMLRVVDAQVLFVANDGSSGFEIWRSDGTAAGTVRVTDLVEGTDGLVNNAFELESATVAGGFYYAATGTRLYRSDGSAAGSRQVGGVFADALRGIEELHGADDRVLFSGDTLSHGRELHQTRIDTPSTYTQVLSIGDEVGHSAPKHMHALARGEIVYAYDDVDGFEWRRFGAQETSLLVELVPGNNTFESLSGFLPPVRSAPDPGQLWFVDNFRKVWITDGSSEGTRMVVDTSTLPLPMSVECLVPHGDGALLLLAASGAHIELWQTDGTAEGTTALLTPQTMPFGVELDYKCPAAVGDAILVHAFSAAAGFELYRNNGTPGHLTLLRDIAPGAASSFAREIVHVQDIAYFVASDQHNDANLELWRTDGTAQGTRLVREINPDASARPHSMVVLDDTLLFVADDGQSGFELWRTDGTLDGTQRLTDLHPGPGDAFRPSRSSTDPLLVAADGRVYFAATTPQGRFLFASDGATDGTQRLSGEGAESVRTPRGIVALRHGGVVFAGMTDDAGLEPWFSGGTQDSTLALADIVPGPDSSSPSGFAPTADGALFAAHDAERGHEPWRLRLPRDPAVFADDFEPTPPSR